MNGAIGPDVQTEFLALANDLLFFGSRGEKVYFSLDIHDGRLGTGKDNLMAFQLTPHLLGEDAADKISLTVDTETQEFLLECPASMKLPMHATFTGARSEIFAFSSSYPETETLSGPFTPQNRRSIALAVIGVVQEQGWGRPANQVVPEVNGPNCRPN